MPSPWMVSPSCAASSPRIGVPSAQGMHRLVLVAGKPSHAPGAHEFRAGARLLARCLAAVPDLVVEVHEQGGVPDLAADQTAAIVLFSDGGPSHPLLEGDRLDALRALARWGVGIGFMHWALEAPPSRGAGDVIDLVGGAYEDGVACNPIWEASFDRLPDHPITRGVSPFTVTDEWYFNLTFPDAAGLTPILVATPADAVRAGPYVWPAGPYPHVQAARGRPETLMWAIERPNGGRAFGLTGGHFHANWANDDFRRVVTNALVWLAGVEVPSAGVASSVTAAELERDLGA
jgi:type 1 glutamine amidotransferase